MNWNRTGPEQAGRASSHLPVPEYEGLTSTIAYPFSPPEIDRGPVFRFTLHHVAVPETPHELFRTVHENIREAAHEEVTA